MEAEALRIKTDELQSSIKHLVDNFISEVGVCEISISTENQFYHLTDGIGHFISSNVKVNVTV